MADEKINPHIPQYISEVPWYLEEREKAGKTPSLRHQRATNLKTTSLTSKWYKRGLKNDDLAVGQKFEKGACTNCGARTHQARDCVDRPRRKTAKALKKKLAPDEYIPEEEMVGFEAKRDRWGGYTDEHFQLDAEERAKLMPEEKEEDLEAGEIEDKSAGRSLRNREDTAKYLINLDVDSAFFDPKSRSLRENPAEGLDEERRRKLALAGKL